MGSGGTCVFQGLWGDARVVWGPCGASDSRFCEAVGMTPALPLLSSAEPPVPESALPRACCVQSPALVLCPGDLGVGGAGGAPPRLLGPDSWSPCPGLCLAQGGCSIQDWGEGRGGGQGSRPGEPLPGLLTSCLTELGDSEPLVVQPAIGCSRGVSWGHSSCHLEAEYRGRVLGQGEVKGEGMADPDSQSSWGPEDWGCWVR